MTYNHGDYVTVYDRNGHVLTKGSIVGLNRVNPAYYDIQPKDEMSLESRLHQIPASMVRKAYVPVDENPKNIKDDL